MSDSSQLFVDDGFNHDFTDEDIRMLISFATSPEYRTHTCHWVEYSGRCGADIEGNQFPVHLSEYHGIVSQDSEALFRCHWEGCTDRTLVSSDGLMGHIRGRHLHWKYLCGDCGAQFSGEAARDGHQAQCGGMSN